MARRPPSQYPRDLREDLTRSALAPSAQPPLTRGPTTKSGPSAKESSPDAPNERGADLSGEVDPGRAEMLLFQEGSESAFDRLVALHQSSVQRFLGRTVRDEGRAEDLTQEVFIRVYKSRGTYQPVASFRTWLFTIAHRLALNEIRAIRRRKRVFADPMGASKDASSPDSGDGSSDFWSSVPERQVEDPAAPLEARELQAFLDVAVAQLPENQRIAIELQRSETFSYQQIADTMDMTTMAVKSLLVRARENLRLALVRYLEGTDESP